MNKIGVAGSLGILVLCLAAAAALLAWQQDNLLRLWNNLTGQATQLETWSVMYYDSEGNELLDEAISVNYDPATGEITGSITEPEAPELEGWTFADWTEAIDKDNKHISYTATYIEGVAWTIRWIAQENEVQCVTVYLDMETGQPVPGTPNADATDPEAPTLEGYVFVEWRAEIDSETRTITNTAIYTLKIISYTVTHYDSEGNVLDSSAQEYYSDGQPVSGVIIHPTPETTATYDNLPFLEWQKVKRGRTIDYYATYGNEYYQYYNGGYAITALSQKDYVGNAINSINLMGEVTSGDLQFSLATGLDITNPTGVEIDISGELLDGTQVEIFDTLWLTKSATGGSLRLTLSNEINWDIVLDESGNLTVTNMIGDYGDITFSMRGVQIVAL